MYEKITAAVEKNSRLILDTERHIWHNPETGFKEWKPRNTWLTRLKTWGIR
jgi:metal-dependent amidase/aminoacylase/carboxypeptidase family protein